MLAQIAMDAGFFGGEVPVAVAVALASSGGDDSWSYLDWAGKPDLVGLWAIPATDPDGITALVDVSRPNGNAAAARALYVASDESWAWNVAYSAGRHTPWLRAGARAAISPRRGFVPQSTTSTQRLEPSLPALGDRADQVHASLMAVARYTPASPNP